MVSRIEKPFSVEKGFSRGYNIFKMGGYYKATILTLLQSLHCVNSENSKKESL